MTKKMWLNDGKVKNSLTNVPEFDFQSIARNHPDFLEQESFYESSKLGERAFSNKT